MTPSDSTALSLVIGDAHEAHADAGRLKKYTQYEVGCAQCDAAEILGEGDGVLGQDITNVAQAADQLRDLGWRIHKGRWCCLRCLPPVLHPKRGTE